MRERPLVDIPTPPGGWLSPWPNVAEIESVLPYTGWTLVGGLMTQLHAARRGVGTVRPTDDVDIVLHVETTPGAPGAAARALESIGYTLLDPVDPRASTAHRFRRERQLIDLVAAATPDDEVVDVLVADHAPPRAVGALRGRAMVAIEGGTQALQRTVNARLSITADRTTTISTPSVLGALVLKAAAFQTDSRDPERHLLDAAVLLACVEDPYEMRDAFKGSDRSRMLTLARNLPADATPWSLLDAARARDGQEALRALTSGLS